MPRTNARSNTQDKNSKKAKPLFDIEEANLDDEYESEDDFDFVTEESQDSESELFSSASSTQSAKSEELNRYENSVLRVDAAGKIYDYKRPWFPPKPVNWSGSGFIINYKGQNCILTNAHVADFPSKLKIRLPDESKQYEATIKHHDHDCDLAMLEVTDKSFWDKVEPLTLGKMVKMRQDIAVVGFPMGGEELCITEGKVSRMEVGEYVQGSTSLLQVQVSAPINPGNSGGMVVDSKHNVVGVAFQGCDFGDGLGFMIPTPVIEHFLKDSLENEVYQGFPDLAIGIQECQNESMRKYHGMKEGQTGIRVRKIDPLSTANGVLKEDDVLLEIDGNKIANDGFISTDFCKRLTWDYLLTSKHIGEPIHVKVLRDGKVKELDIPLLHRAGTTKKIQLERDKSPSFYINSGLIMSPLTVNEETLQTIELTEKAKKKAGDEFVVINTVLGCDHTESYEHLEREFIREVNGKKVRNLREVAEAFDNNPNDYHVLKLAKDENQKIIIKKMTSKEQKALFHEYGLHTDRSNDLKEEPLFKPGCPEYYAFSQFKLTKEKLDAKKQNALKLRSGSEDEIAPPTKKSKRKEKSKIKC